MTDPTVRTGADRCPGLLRPFVADDGALVRLRLPGGSVPTATLSELGAIAAAHGAPFLQLTSRGNLQLRSLPNPLPAQLVSRIEATGLLPSASHERVRNILADPFEPTLQPLVEQLDAALIDDPTLADLPGRWLFALSGPTGQVLGEPYDVAFQQLSVTHGRLMVGGMGADCSVGDAVAAMIARAWSFLEHRPDASCWNVRDLPADSPVFAHLAPLDVSPTPPPAPGRHGNFVVLGIPLGMLTIRQIELLAGTIDQVIVTPWRSLVVAAEVDEAAFAAAGFALSPDSPWTRLSSCVGAPWCRRTDSPTLELATTAAAVFPADGPRTHVVGCDRACGRPATAHRLVVAPPSVEEILP